MTKQARRILLVLLSGLCMSTWGADFAAEGMTEPKLPRKGTGAVTVTFDKVPYSMAFNLPWQTGFLSSDGVAAWNGIAVTADPKHCKGPAAISQDHKGRYARMWIQQQSAARILVRTKGALCDRNAQIAHSDVESGSPYGKGDWTDEWHFIYPDGLAVRTVRIYTGAATGRTLPFQLRHTALGDGSDPLLTLMRTDGTSRTIDPAAPAISRDQLPGANIRLLNVKDVYKPFTIVPEKQGASPYRHGDKQLTWVTLNGLAAAEGREAQVKALLPVARAWLNPPAATVLTDGFVARGYSTLQRATVVDRGSKTKGGLVIEVSATEAQPALNPVFVLRNWGTEKARAYVNGLPVGSAKVRIGVEKTAKRMDLVVWIEGHWTATTQFGIRPAN